MDQATGRASSAASWHSIVVIRARRLRSLAKRFARAGFELGQRVRFNVLPLHFYSETPNISALRTSNTWRGPMNMDGVQGKEISHQLAKFNSLWEEVSVAELERLAVYHKAIDANLQGGGYGPVEADVLFAFIVHYRPARVVQIGCGVATAIILQAAEYVAYEPDIVCVEPFPSPYLEECHRQGRVHLIRQGAEAVDMDVFLSFKPGDFLFVDSTHCVRPGSEVNRIILNILPCLASDIHVHFHDIYFPYDYQRGILTHELFFHSESTLLHALLVGNAKLGIMFSLSMLHYAAPEAITKQLPYYRPQPSADGLATAQDGHFPSATYLITGAGE